jgi:acylphosphatase
VELAVEGSAKEVEAFLAELRSQMGRFIQSERKVEATPRQEQGFRIAR